MAIHGMDWEPAPALPHRRVSTGPRKTCIGAPTSVRVRTLADNRGYEAYQPGYRYGFESAKRHAGRKWDEIESDLRSGWDRYEHRGQSAWENIKDAVRNAWDRVTGDRPRGTDRDTVRSTY